MKVKSLSRVLPSATPWTAAYQAPVSIEFSRQEYWSGVPLPSPSRSIGTKNSELLSIILLNIHKSLFQRTERVKLMVLKRGHDLDTKPAT